MVVETVAAEVQRYEAGALEYPQVVRVPDVTRSEEEWARRLDDGEVAALSLALTYQPSDQVVFMCDERTARQTASSLGLPVIGSLGLILAAFRSDRVTRETAK